MTSSSLFSLKGKVAAIIGAASGIGEAIALGCARNGADVHCLDVKVFYMGDSNSMSKTS